MKITYVAHACLRIEAGETTIITDPWINGPAYCGQWHLFPRPVNLEEPLDADVILLTHGHEDHLHEPTLRVLPKRAHVFYPYTWYGGVQEFARELGYDAVTEARTGRSYTPAPGVRVTYIANNLDSIVVVEHNGTVVVNVNDALHAYHPNIIDTFLRIIRERWPHIDILFCGFGGASYFPNAIHTPTKNDLEIAQAREQLFAHNFCRIVHGLAPAVAVPFAADFVLLDPWQRWINTARFSRADIPEYYRSLYGTDNTVIQPMYPGDQLHGRALVPASPYRMDLRGGSLDHLIEAQYAAEIARRNIVTYLSRDSAEELRQEIETNVQRRARLFKPRALEGLRFSIDVADVSQDGCYAVSFREGRACVMRAHTPDPEAAIIIRTRSAILRYAFAGEWGGDAITIGYGAEVFVLDEAHVEAGLDSVCIRLLTNHPTTTRHMRKEPLRALRFLATNPTTRRWAVKQVLAGGAHSQEQVGRNTWLLRSKCEICRICDLPMLDTRFSETVNAVH